MWGNNAPNTNRKLSPAARMTSLLLCVIFGIASSHAAFVVSNGSRGVVRSSSLSNNRVLGQTQSRFMGAQFVSMRPAPQSSKIKRGGSKGTELGMFLGTDGGILGVGAPEIAVTLLVGYFILGPSELYKLTKEIGKFIQNFRTLGAEATKTFESTMEDQLELDELRKAQSELSNAFNFRRSINVDQESEAFTELPPSVDPDFVPAVPVAAAVSDSATGGTKRKKRKRKRVKKVEEVPVVEDDDEIQPYVQDIPDLDMSDAFEDLVSDDLRSDPFEEEEEASARIREERMSRLQNGAPPPPGEDTTPDWASASPSDLANEVLGGNVPSAEEQSQAIAEQSRFAAQLSNDWNSGIVENEDELSPLAKVMDRLAILEKERDAANARLEDEFRLRTEVEEKFYREKRAVLEDAAGEISSKVYGDFGSEEGSTVDMQ